MSHVHDIATAVQSLLNAHTFTPAFTASIKYDTELELEDTATLHVDIVAATVSQTLTSRISLQSLVGVDIAVRYRFGTSDQNSDGSVTQSKVDTYLELLEAIAKYLAKYPNLATPLARWNQNVIKASWVGEHMRQNRQYTGILQAIYSVEDDLS